MTTFAVDTHLFRELGELLVGRDSTALIELIKNAYDADAMAGHDLVMAIDQNRNRETESFNAPRNLPDLPGTMAPRIPRIEDERSERQIGDDESTKRGNCRHYRLPP